VGLLLIEIALADLQSSRVFPSQQAGPCVAGPQKPGFCPGTYRQIHLSHKAGAFFWLLRTLPTQFACHDNR
jgi:hypothetical protein